MSERFTRLHTLPPNLYLKGAPILIAAGALLKDVQSNQVLVQLKLQNLNEEILSACKISIKAFDPSGAELSGVESYSYLDLAVPRGNDFGSKNPIYLPDNTTRNISVSVIQAVFADGRVWEHPFDDWKEILPKQKRISEEFSDIELQKQYFLDVGGNCEYIPVVSDGLFLCTCGAVNLSQDEICAKCGRSARDLFSSLDLTELTRKKEERLAQEEAERLEQERIAEEKRIAAKKAKRICLIARIIALVIIASFFTVTKVIIPESKYATAVKLLEQRDYDGAATTFSELGEYRDAPEQIEKIPSAKSYVKAEDMLNAGDYRGAIVAFEALGGYKDAPEQANEARQAAYDHAKSLLESGNYDESIDLFLFLFSGDYKDAPGRVTEARQAAYDRAKSSLETGDYDESISLFLFLGDFSDSAECLKEAHYQKAKFLLQSKDYENAVIAFRRLVNYKDSPDLLLQAQKGYQMEHSTN